MAELCSIGCHIVCDFCCYYKDESELKQTKEFEGEGICELDGSATDASGGCNKFKCIRLE